MSAYTSEPVLEDVRKVRTLELANVSRRTSTVDDRSLTVNQDVAEHGWSEYRQPYSPWTGIKTAVAIAVLLTIFVVYVTVRTRCSSACRRDACLRLRRAVRSAMPSWMLPRRHGSDDDEAKDRRQSPIIAESSKQCLRRVELELTEVISEQKPACSDRAADNGLINQSVTTT